MSDTTQDDSSPDSARDTQYDQYPLVSDGLLDALRKAFPNNWPDIGWMDREIWVRAGQLSVIDHLAFIQKQQLAELSKSKVA